MNSHPLATEVCHESRSRMQQPRMSDIYMNTICLTTRTGSLDDSGAAVLLSPSMSHP